MNLPNLKIGDLVSKLPIVQGGMGVGISLSSLASAVANAGGIGVISAAVIGFREPDNYKNFREANMRAMRKEIQLARENTDGVIGVNIMVALSNFSDMVKTSIQEGIDVIFAGAGLPLDLPKYLEEDSHTKLAPIVSSARAAKIICKKWLLGFDYLPDAVVVEGPLAGGHLGFKNDDLDKPESRLENIIPQVVEALKPYAEKAKRSIPVIAAGGIYTGADIKKFLDLGADAVQMGTRFVTTTECDASDGFKQAYLDAAEEDITVIKSPVGLPGRAVLNDFIQSTRDGLTKPFKCPYHCITTCDYKKSPYCIAMALINAQKGVLGKGFAFAGQNAYRADKIVSVKELFSELIEQFDQASAPKAVTA